jgi:hypothetical protein
MKLHDRVLEGLAEMIVGDNPLFPYRSSYFIIQFFRRCGLPYIHDGTTRRFWVKDVLQQLNTIAPTSPDVPSNEIIRIVDELFDPFEFDHAKKNPEAACENLTKLLGRHGLKAHLDQGGRCRIINPGTGTTVSAALETTRPLSSEENANRQKVEKFLDAASEDELTEKLLVPFFQRLGFHRVSRTGHRERALEFGKDLWMKFQLPTGHWLYFAAQIKAHRIDAGGTSGSNNVANVLTQAKMALTYHIFDPETNQKVLPDHVFVIAGGEITRGARNWIDENLDSTQLRQIILMDRAEFLDRSARILLDLRIEIDSTTPEDIPF